MHRFPERMSGFTLQYLLDGFLFRLANVVSVFGDHFTPKAKLVIVNPVPSPDHSVSKLYKMAERAQAEYLSLIQPATEEHGMEVHVLSADYCGDKDYAEQWAANLVPVIFNGLGG
jgi:hypothetical protein